MASQVSSQSNNTVSVSSTVGFLRSSADSILNNGSSHPYSASSPENGQSPQSQSNLNNNSLPSSRLFQSSTNSILENADPHSYSTPDTNTAQRLRAQTNNLNHNSPSSIGFVGSSDSILSNSNSHPYSAPSPEDNQQLHLQPRVVYLKDHVTHATIYPITSTNQISTSMISLLQHELNQEILRGDTYPMDEEMDFEKFVNYWFECFAALMLLGKPEDHGDLAIERDWSSLFLGTFYVKPNYPGRSSHVANGGFLTALTARGKGCGKLMGEAYLDFAPKLGFTYSVFNLVYETNTASTKIWDSLGFKRIGCVRGAGRLRSCPNILVDAIIYGRDLKDDDDYVSEERFDKIRFYLEKGKYPPSADRSEKSRLRSAATHYRFTNGKLMLKDKEVVSDSQLQYEIARNVHAQFHGGINKTTATIAEKYHWVRIKETVSLVIRNCSECKEHGKIPAVKAEGHSSPKRVSSSKQSNQSLQKQETPEQQSPPSRQLQLQLQLQPQQHNPHHHTEQQQLSLHVDQAPINHQTVSLLSNGQLPVDMSRATAMSVVADNDINIPVDPQMMEGVEHHQNPPQHAHFIHQLHQYSAPVASMHTLHHIADHGMSARAPRAHQNVAVVTARAALSEGAEALTGEGGLKDRHLLERLTAELKKNEYADLKRDCYTDED